MMILKTVRFEGHYWDVTIFGSLDFSKKMAHQKSVATPAITTLLTP